MNRKQIEAYNLEFGKEVLFFYTGDGGQESYFAIKKSKGDGIGIISTNSHGDCTLYGNATTMSSFHLREILAFMDMLDAKKRAKP